MPPSRWPHALEDAFVAAQRGPVRARPAEIDVLLSGVDFLARIAAIAEDDLPSWQAEQAVEVEAMVAELTGDPRGPG